MNHERLDVDEDAPASTRKSFVRRFRSEILAEWTREVRALPSASNLAPITLLDHIPDVLDQIADIAEQILCYGRARGDCETAYQHALERLDVGFDIAETITELSVLRGCILAVWSRDDEQAHDKELAALNLAIDRIIMLSAKRYSELRDRTLDALDRIASAALTAPDIHELLRRLLSVVMRFTPAVDTAAIMLREGDRLFTRAAAGLEEELGDAFSLAIGEGFCGRVAADQRPHTLRSAYLDPMIKSPAIRNRRVLALYGVPLVHNGELIGVAHMGSLSTHEFSEEDRQLFASMASRATAGIRHHLLRQELRWSEERNQQNAEQRESTLAELRGAMRAREDVLAVVSHDLRNPLGTIVLSVSMLLADLSSDTRPRRHLEIIQRSAGRMDHLINDLLDSTSIQTGKLVLRPSPTPARAILDEAIKLHDLTASERQIRLERAEHLGGVIVSCDHDRMLQVFGNLIGNALKFCSPGSTVTVTGCLVGDEAKFSVEDTGPGIPPSVLNRLFEPYLSAPEQNRRGVGLGLFISKGLVEGHGGRIWVETELDVGTKFFFTLPVIQR